MYVWYSKKLLPYIKPKNTKICEFEEMEGSFVGEGLSGSNSSQGKGKDAKL
jgi:hypothetical protein